MPTPFMTTANYIIVVRIDGYENDPSGGDWFCYHTSSPMILPPGFSERHNIKLKVILTRTP
jgi:hypothetical protein